MKKRILFVRHFSSKAKFVSNDFDILKSEFDVDEYQSRLSSNLLSIFSILHQFFFTLFKMRKYDLTFVWFADYHSLLPVFFAKLFGKKSVIAVGGYDATYIPEINMGVFTKSSFRKRLRCFAATYSLQNCSLILPVDKSLIRNENRYIYSDKHGKPVLKDGILNLVSGVKARIETLHLGYDPRIFQKRKDVTKERAIVSAGFIENVNEYRRKGFDILVSIAPKMPDVKFILIGLNDEFMNKLSALKYDNLELYGKISYEKLVELYSRAKVYSQLSLFEGMPSAVCEAMLCECTPVGSDVNGIPFIIGDTGYIVKEKHFELVMNIFEKALGDNEQRGIKARERIIENFSLEERKKLLIEIAKGIM